MVNRRVSGSRLPMNRRTNSSLTMHTGMPALVSPAEKFRPRRSGMSNVERYVGLMIWYADAVRAGRGLGASPSTLKICPNHTPSSGGAIPTPTLRTPGTCCTALSTFS
jgi:hypothetical protein